MTCVLVLIMPAVAAAMRVPRIAMRVDAIESTPNPSSFLLRLDEPVEGFTVTGNKLRGQTFSRGSAAPPALAAVLAVDGVKEVYAMEQLVTVSKDPAASWDKILDAVVAALGGSTERLVAQGVPGADRGAPAGEAAVSGGVTIRLQVSQKLPIQVEASGWTGSNPPVRMKLSPRFGSAMGLMVGESGDAFFKGRSWLDRGLRYPEDDGRDGAGEAGDEAKAESELERERRAMATALSEEVAEVEAAYPDERLASIIFKKKRPAAKPLPGGGSALSLEEVDRLCDDDSEGDGDDAALKRLAAFVASAGGELGARRMAVAYLGSTAGRGGDAAFEAISAAFRLEKAAGMRRTAGDALSDLGDGRAVPLAVSGLADTAALVRWRAARILGELGGSAAVAAALRQALLQEAAFEVRFELGDAKRRVDARVAGEADGPSGPMWMQIQKGMK